MWFEYFTERIGDPTVFEAMASGRRHVDAARQGKAATHLTGSGEYTRPLNQNRNFAKNEARVSEILDDVPSAADIETWPEGTRNTVFAKYAFSVRR